MGNRPIIDYRKEIAFLRKLLNDHFDDFNSEEQHELIDTIQKLILIKEFQMGRPNVSLSDRLVDSMNRTGHKRNLLNIMVLLTKGDVSRYNDLLKMNDDELDMEIEKAIISEGKE